MSFLLKFDKKIPSCYDTFNDLYHFAIILLRSGMCLPGLSNKYGQNIVLSVQNKIKLRSVLYPHFESKGV